MGSENSIESLGDIRSTAIFDKNDDTVVAIHGESSKDKLGNLADELADVWNEDEEEGESRQRQSVTEYCREDDPNFQQEFGAGALFAMPSSPPSLLIPSNRHRSSSQYDGSDCDGDSDLDRTGGMLPSLGRRLTAIDNLVRSGNEASGNDLDDIVNRVANSLKDIPSQSAIENGTTRLITSHTALTSHLPNQTRNILTLVHSVLSPLSTPPGSEVVDEVVLLLADLLTYLPTPTTQCLNSLHSLASCTTDLQTTLTYLSDTVYMTRQTSTQASRKLKMATDLVVELRHDAEAQETGVRWIENGKWNEKLANRECARVCGEVVEGFEKACDGWRRKLSTETHEVEAA